MTTTKKKDKSYALSVTKRVKTPYKISPLKRINNKNNNKRFLPRQYPNVEGALQKQEKSLNN